jgi:hypothetical protein
MTSEEQRRLAVVETRVEAIDGALQEIKDDVKEVLATVNRAHGAGKVAMWVAGLGGGAAGASAIKFLLPLVK